MLANIKQAGWCWLCEMAGKIWLKTKPKVELAFKGLGIFLSFANRRYNLHCSIEIVFGKFCHMLQNKTLKTPSCAYDQCGSDCQIARRYSTLTSQCIIEDSSNEHWLSGKWPSKVQDNFEIHFRQTLQHQPHQVLCSNTTSIELKENYFIVWYESSFLDNKG